ncbi:MAG: LOG family protein [bacterium]|nr:LOG family protein [bacterium]
MKKNFFFNEISTALESISQFQIREKKILDELLKPKHKFEKLGVQNTIVFFGSAIKLKDTKKITPKIKKMAEYYNQAEKLSYKITRWVNTKFKNPNHCVVCSGGGPGIMEAANKGAKQAGGQSIGLNIKIKYEQIPNKYQSEELKLQFHYFFMRKFWFSYLAKAIIVFPGGFGTLDKLFEIYTLIKTNKIHNYAPIILFGKDF